MIDRPADRLSNAEKQTSTVKLSERDHALLSFAKTVIDGVDRAHRADTYAPFTNAKCLTEGGRRFLLSEDKKRREAVILVEMAAALEERYTIRSERVAATKRLREIEPCFARHGRTFRP